MTDRGWRSWYPRSWRDRYGEEYDQLLEDLGDEHRLSLRTRLDVYRAGLSLHRSCADGRRRILVVAAVTLLLATGIGLGLGLSGSNDGGSYLATFGADGGTPRSVTLTNTISPVSCSTNPSGASLAQSRLWRPLVPTTRNTSSGTIDGLTWSVLTAQPAATHVTQPFQQQAVANSALQRVVSGAITLDGHWYSLCPPTGPTPGLTTVMVSGNPTLTVVNIKGHAIAYGLVPSTATAQDLSVSADGKSPVRPLVLASGIAGYSIYVAVLPEQACGVRRVEVSDVSPEFALQNFGTFGATPCLPYQLLPTPGLDREGGYTFGSGPRSEGTVTTVGASSFVVATSHWAPLHVTVPTNASVYFFAEGSYGYLKGSLSDLERCDPVFVAGTISSTTATATAVFVQASAPAALLHRLPKTVDVYNSAGKLTGSLSRQLLTEPVDQLGTQQIGSGPLASQVGRTNGRSAPRSTCS